MAYLENPSLMICKQEQQVIELYSSDGENYKCSMDAISFLIYNLLCCSGQAILVADGLSYHLIKSYTTCLIEKIHNNTPIEECNDKIFTLEHTLNEHLQMFHYWFPRRWFCKIKRWYRAQKLKKNDKKTVKVNK